MPYGALQGSRAAGPECVGDLGARARVCVRASVCVCVCASVCDVLGANRQSYVYVNSSSQNIAPWGIQFLVNPPRAFASQLSKTSDTEQAHSD